MSKTQSGFGRRALYHVKAPKAFHVARQKLSFLIASLSLLAFVAGNMVGQHGLYAFWNSVLGREDDTMIAFVGTVSPIAKIPDYLVWAQYGGNKRDHTFAEVPQIALRDLPPYDQAALTAGTASDLAKQAYSTLWAGGYNSPYGSHSGVDIDAPRGTPVVSIANGVVEKVSRSDIGFGYYVLIRHPNVPVQEDGVRTSTLYSTYAHLDRIDVTEGQVVHKGEHIGTVGNTGTVFGATGYHLYFQVEKASALFHPYWPFTSDDARQYGLSFVQAVNSTLFRGNVLSYTLNPMAFVSKFATYTAQTIVRNSDNSTNGVTAQATISSLSEGDRLRLLAAERRSRRSIGIVARVPDSASSSSISVDVPAAPVISSDIKTATVAMPIDSSGGVDTDVDRLSIKTSGTLSPVWQKVRIITLDKNGNRVLSPSFGGRLYVVSDFGEAVIRPSELSSLDFVNGVATVNVLARGTKTIFISTRGAFYAISDPMIFDR